MEAFVIEKDRQYQRGHAIGAAPSQEEEIRDLKRRVLRLEGILERLTRREDKE